MTRIFELDKETKGTFRFREVEKDGQPVMSGTLYIRKAAVAGSWEPPQTLTVTVEEF